MGANKALLMGCRAVVYAMLQDNPELYENPTLLRRRVAEVESEVSPNPETPPLTWGALDALTPSLIAMAVGDELEGLSAITQVAQAIITTSVARPLACMACEMDYPGISDGCTLDCCTPGSTDSPGVMST